MVHNSGGVLDKTLTLTVCVQDEDIPLATPILDDQAPERAGAPQIPTYQTAVEDLESSQGPAVEAVKSRLQLLHSILQVGTLSLYTQSPHRGMLY